MNNDIKVSVVIPIYNVEEYLYECLESVANQTLKDIEVLMIDDGSTDNSGKIAKEFGKKHPNFHYHYKENGGLGNARNYAIPYVKGKYLIFLDSDDVVPNYAYEKMYDLAERTGNDMIIGNVKRFNSTKTWDSVMLHKKVFVEDLDHTHILNNPNLIYDTTSWNKLFKTEFYLKNNFKFPENILYEDIPVTIPAHFKANSVGVITDVCYLWRVRDGVTKSITQDRTAVSNFLDRIKIMDMVEDFYAKNVTDQQSLIMKDFKWLEIDLKLYVNQMKNASEDFQKIAFREINRYLEHIGKEPFNKLRAIDKLKYYYISKNDLKGLICVLDYQKKGYKTLKIRKKENNYYGDFPMKVDQELKNMTQELEYFPLTQSIQNVLVDDDKLFIDFYMYIPKLKTQYDFKTNAYLYSKKSNKTVEIKIYNDKSKFLRNRSYQFSRHPLKISKYDYSHCAYHIIINLDDIKIINMLKDDCYIKILYENNIIKKEFVLSHSNTVSKVEKNSFYKEGIMNTYLVDKGYFIVKYLTNVNIINDIKIDNQMLIFPDDTCNLSFNNTANSITFKENQINTNDLKTLVYQVNSNKTPIYYKGRNQLSHINNKIITIDTDKFLKLNVSIFDSKVSITNYFLQQDKLYIIFKSYDDEISKCKKVVIENKKYNYRLYFDVEVDIKSENHISLKTCIDLNDKILQNNLANGSYDIYLQQDPAHIYKSVSLPNTTEMQTVVNDLTIKIVCENNSLTLKVGHKWKKYENSKRKRRIIKKYIYPLLRILPIQKKCIIFEGWWGSKYHCNPKYLYEYINKNHSEFKCIWFLNDDNIPINGNAIKVRRKSLKYYYYLSVGKYFVNNVNFHDEYVKRKSQIEIQTMHGTPLKTLGLDVPGELTTDQKRNNFIRRCDRWNYLVVQSDKASKITASCYNFKKEFLRTGYPRNDILFEKNNQAEIGKLKKKMGIPTNKKVILYAPTWRRRNYFEMHLNINDMKEKFSDEYVLLLRVHPFAYKGLNKSILNDFVLDFSTYESVEELYLISDIVITDYSSVMFDYTILNRPILFFTYDLEEYRDNLRGFNFDFESEAPGPLISTYEDLKEKILNIEETYKDYYEALQRFRNKFNEYESGSASKQIFNKVFK